MAPPTPQDNGTRRNKRTRTDDEPEQQVPPPAETTPARTAPKGFKEPKEKRPKRPRAEVTAYNIRKLVEAGKITEAEANFRLAQSTAASTFHSALPESERAAKIARSKAGKKPVKGGAMTEDLVKVMASLASMCESTSGKSRRRRQ